MCYWLWFTPLGTSILYAKLPTDQSCQALSSSFVVCVIQHNVYCKSLLRIIRVLLLYLFPFLSIHLLMYMTICVIIVSMLCLSMFDLFNIVLFKLHLDLKQPLKKIMRCVDQRAPWGGPTCPIAPWGTLVFLLLLSFWEV